MSHWKGWLRIGLLAATGGTLFWCFSALNSLPDSGQADHIADRVARGEPYDLPVLKRATADLDVMSRRTCDARFLTSYSIIQAKIIDLEFAGQELDAVDRDMELMRSISSRLVECVPMASIGWLGLYWVNTVRDGFRPSDLRLLARSYDTGRKERWIEVRRNRLAFAVYDHLGPEMQEIVLDEFVDLVGFAALDQAAYQFLRLDPSVQQVVFTKLERLSLPVRSGLYRKLRHLGFEDVPAYGHPRRNDQPWIN